MVEEFAATANSSGQIVINFTMGTADQPKVSGIQILGTAGTAAPARAMTTWTVTIGTTATCAHCGFRPAVIVRAICSGAPMSMKQFYRASSLPVDDSHREFLKLTR